MMYDHFFTFRNTRLIATSDPVKSLWDYFRNISDLPYLNKKWPFASDDAKLKVSTYIKQAYEYKIVSDTSSFLIKPVLSYYSLHNLTKAVLHLRNVETNVQYHGLCKCEPSERFTEGRVLTNDGVFSSLSHVFGYAFDNNEVLTVEELMMNTVEGDSFLADYFDSEKHFMNVRWHGTYDGYITIELLNWNQVAKDPEDLGNKIHELTDLLGDFDLLVENGVPVLRSKEKCVSRDFDAKAADLAQKHFFQNIYDDYPRWIKLVRKERKFHPALAYYALMYIFSSYSRYNPEWMNKNIRRIETGYEYLIEQMIKQAERSVPNLFVNLINDACLVYR